MAISSAKDLHPLGQVRRAAWRAACAPAPMTRPLRLNRPPPTGTCAAAVDAGSARTPGDQRAGCRPASDPRAVAPTARLLGRTVGPRRSPVTGSCPAGSRHPLENRGGFSRRGRCRIRAPSGRRQAVGPAPRLRHGPRLSSWPIARCGPQAACRTCADARGRRSRRRPGPRLVGQAPATGPSPAPGHRPAPAGPSPAGTGRTDPVAALWSRCRR